MDNFRADRIHRCARDHDPRAPLGRCHVHMTLTMNRRDVPGTSCGKRRQRVASLRDLPPHVWALVLRHGTVSDVVSLAHTCRALHKLVTSHERCACASGSTPLWSDEGTSARALWTHLRHAHFAGPSHNEFLAMARAGSVAHIGVALRGGYDPSFWNQAPIEQASEHGQLDVVELLLRDARVDPTEDDQYAIRWASFHGHVAVVDRLLRDARVDPSADEQFGLRLACLSGDVAVLDRLLSDARVDPSAKNQYAIRWASRKGHLAVVERLLRDERVANDMCALYDCMVTARDGQYYDVAWLLESHCATRDVGE